MGQGTDAGGAGEPYCREYYLAQTEASELDIQDAGLFSVSTAKSHCRTDPYKYCGGYHYSLSVSSQVE